MSRRHPKTLTAANEAASSAGALRVFQRELGRGQRPLGMVTDQRGDPQPLSAKFQWLFPSGHVPTCNSLCSGPRCVGEHAGSVPGPSLCGATPVSG